MKNILFLAIIISFTWALNSCNKEEYEVFDQAFFHIHSNNQDTLQIRFNRKDTVEYYVYLSSKLQFDPIQVNWNFSVENLQENVDFKILNSDKTLVFNPGIFEMPIRIAWLENPVDESKVSSLTLTIESNSANIPIGLPGPDKNQQSMTILKVK